MVETVKQFNRLDILVNNAGKFMPKPLEETTESDFDGVVALNAKGPYFAMQEAARVLKDGGRIVNISTGGTHLSFPEPRPISGARPRLNNTPRDWLKNWPQGDHGEYRLPGVYRNGDDDGRVSADRNSVVADETTRCPKRYCRCRGVHRERRGAVAHGTDDPSRRRHRDVTRHDGADDLVL